MARIWNTKFLLTADGAQDAEQKIDGLMGSAFYSPDRADGDRIIYVYETWIGDPFTPAVGVKGRVEAPTAGEATDRFGDMIRAALNLNPAGIVGADTALARED